MSQDGGPAMVCHLLMYKKCFVTGSTGCQKESTN